jgi:thiol-disulfide isomerase/thioredoxin
MTNLLLGLAFATIGLQDIPQDIDKKQLPAKAVCVVCEANGGGHGEEKPAAGVMFKGKAYYFCNAKEPAEFKKDPEAFLPPVLPRAMPALDLPDHTGKLWNAAAFKDRVVLIDFWATWCGPCKALMPRLDKLVSDTKDPNFSLLSVSIDEKKADYDKFIEKKKDLHPWLWDDKQVFANWKIRVIPTLFLVKDGQIIGQWTGAPKKGELETAVANALKS